MSRTTTARLAGGLVSGVVLLALTGVNSSSVASSPDRAALDGSGPNGAPSTATAAAHQAMKTIAPAGNGTVKYLGKSRMKTISSTAPASTRAAGHSALRVPDWFKGPNVGASDQKVTATRGPLVTTPTVVRLNKGGTKDSQSSCFCQPPDTNGAISGTRIVEAVNLAMTIYQRNGALVKRQSLASFFPTSRPITDPRIQFDNRNKRWILTFIPEPETTTTTPQMFLAVSTTASPGGSYFKYVISFSGSLFPAGTLLDYPMLGQDTNAIIMGTNNFQLTTGGFVYINSTTFAIPKAAVYSGGGFSFPAFPVAFSTHPAVAQGKPMAIYPRAYLVAANSSGGYSVYFLTNTAGTPSLTFQGNTTGGMWSPPPPATQPAPNAGVHLDTLDGRLSAEPIQDANFVWFTHTVNLSGFPAVRYGAISQAALGVTSADAFATSTSNDWNPSIGVAETASNSDRIFLSWAMNDPAAGQNVSLRVSGVGPGEGIPSLAGVGTTLFTGSGSPTQTRFGDYSSTTVDVKNVSTTCLANTQALVVNQVFNAGDWQARLARVGTC